MRLLVLGLLFAASSAMADAPAVKPLTPDPHAAPAPPLSVWTLDAAGGLEHLQSGLVCSDRIGGYKRTDVRVYDAFGLDVGCNYLEGPSDITVYLTRRGGEGLEPSLAEAKRELLETRAALHPLLLAETHSAEAGLEWTTTVYGVDGGKRTSIWMADLQGWTLEYRESYLIADEAQALADLQRVTAMVQASAGARLSLCTKSPVPKRDGAPVTNTDDLKQSSMMTSLLGGAALAVSKDAKATPGPPNTWCVEAPVTAGKRQMVYWRAVGSDGADGRSDKISLTTMDAPPTLLIAPDSMAFMVESAAKSDGKPLRWIASLQSGDQTLIFGYFDGRPSAETVAALFSKILDGSAKAVGGYSAKGKTISIIVP